MFLEVSYNSRIALSNLPEHRRRLSRSWCKPSEARWLTLLCPMSSSSRATALRSTSSLEVVNAMIAAGPPVLIRAQQELSESGWVQVFRVAYSSHALPADDTPNRLRGPLDAVRVDVEMGDRS